MAISGAGTILGASVLAFAQTRAAISGKENDSMKLLTYLNYGGNCEQAFRFYERHLGGKITMMMTHGQSPNATDVAAD